MRGTILTLLVAAGLLTMVSGQVPAARGYVVGFNEGDLRTDTGGRTTSITVSPNQGSTDLSFWTTQIPSGERVLVHRHDRTEEILFVHRGTGMLLLDDESLAVQEGATIYVPRGTYHGFNNTGSSEAVIAFVATPPGLIDFIRGISWPVGDTPRSLTVDDIRSLEEEFDSIARPE